MWLSNGYIGGKTIKKIQKIFLIKVMIVAIQRGG